MLISVDLKNNKRDYRKVFWIFLGMRIAAINVYQFDLDKPWDTVMKSISTPFAPFLQGQGAMPPSCSRSPASLCVSTKFIKGLL